MQARYQNSSRWQFISEDPVFLGDPRQQNLADPQSLNSPWTTRSASNGASWTNQVERWFAELTRKQIQRGVHTSVRQLEADIRTFIDLHNRNPRPFKWTKSADQIWLPSNASATKPSRLYVANFRFT
jgi:hypothetical protein